MFVAFAIGQPRCAVEHVGVGAIRATVHALELGVFHPPGVQVRHGSDGLPRQQIAHRRLSILVGLQHCADISVPARVLGEIQVAPVGDVHRRRGVHQRREDAEKGDERGEVSAHGCRDEQWGEFRRRKWIFFHL